MLRNRGDYDCWRLHFDGNGLAPTTPNVGPFITVDFTSVYFDGNTGPDTTHLIVASDGTVNRDMLMDCPKLGMNAQEGPLSATAITGSGSTITSNTITSSGCP